MQFSDGVGRFNEETARVASWFALFLTLVVTYEVFMRYFFRSPSIWAFEISWQLYAAHFMLGWAFVEREGKHVRVDVIYNKFSPRVRRFLDLFFFFGLLLPLVGFIVFYGVQYAGHSWMIQEGSHFTIWSPPIYPIKTLIPFCFFMLGLQGSLNLLRKSK